MDNINSTNKSTPVEYIFLDYLEARHLLSMPGIIFALPFSKNQNLNYWSPILFNADIGPLVPDAAPITALNSLNTLHSFPFAGG
jgi:hypothetical protein